MTFYRNGGKRALDVVLAVALLLGLLPLFLLVSVFVRVRVGAPILFRQQRPGFMGHPFTIYKFRTMKDLRDEDGRLLPDAERLSEAGRLLRRTSLDELPELVNVLKGEMSLVGPRPLLMRYLERYTPEQMRRHEVRPGMTGWAQVKGRNLLSWEEKFRLDIWYVENHSLRLDLEILALTVRQVLSGEGVRQPGAATVKEYMGPK